MFNNYQQTQQEEEEYLPPRAMERREALAAEAQRQQAAAAQAQAEANQPAPVPESVQERIQLEALNFFKQRMAEENQKTANQREAETLEAKANQIATQLEQMFVNPTLYSNLGDVQRELDSTLARLQQLNGADPGNQSLLRNTGGRNLYFIDGQILTDDTPMSQG